MKLLPVAIAALLVAVAAPAQAETPRGRLSGGEHYTLPDWFKLSFLDIPQDVAEARAKGRHLLVFLHMDECPYCARMIKENFAAGDNQPFIKQHFDVVAINVRGDREVTWTDGKTYSEKDLARAVKVLGTPTIVFLYHDGKKALQLNGYRDPRAFRDALEFVHGQHYRKQALSDFVRARDKPPVYTLRPHPRFAEVSDFRGYRGPLALLFEDRDCAPCADFHERVLARPDVQAEMAKLRFVRLDAYSDRSVTDLDGNATTAGRWAAALGLSYRPGLVLFDEGREIARADGRLYSFHFRELLRYVSGGHYRRLDSYSKYVAERQDELLKQGVSINMAE